MKPPFPADLPPHPFDPVPGPGHPAFERAARLLALRIFLASLAMLFGASMLAYLIIRLTGDTAPQPGSMHLPAALWISTLLLLASGWTIHRAQAAGRAGDLARMQRGLLATTLLAVAFLAVQAPCLMIIAADHDAALTQKVGLYGAMFFLIVVHALHVIGGFVPLGWLVGKSLRGRLSIADQLSVRLTALYWHFLDGVWIVMFGTFLISR